MIFISLTFRWSPNHFWLRQQTYLSTPPGNGREMHPSAKWNFDTAYINLKNVKISFNLQECNLHKTPGQTCSIEHHLEKHPATLQLVPKENHITVYSQILIQLSELRQCRENKIDCTRTSYYLYNFMRIIRYNIKF